MLCGLVGHLKWKTTTSSEALQEEERHFVTPTSVQIIRFQQWRLFVALLMERVHFWRGWGHHICSLIGRVSHPSFCFTGKNQHMCNSQHSCSISSFPVCISHHQQVFFFKYYRGGKWKFEPGNVLITPWVQRNRRGRYNVPDLSVWPLGSWQKETLGWLLLLAGFVM